MFQDWMSKNRKKNVKISSEKKNSECMKDVC